MKQIASPPPQYSQPFMAQALRDINVELEKRFVRGQDVEIQDGRVILRSPNGNRWALTVSNAGVLSATAL